MASRRSVLLEDEHTFALALDEREKVRSFTHSAASRGTRFSDCGRLIPISGPHIEIVSAQQVALDPTYRDRE